MFDLHSFDVGLYDTIIARGLSTGVGKRNGQMCIEAAICTVLGLDHGDDPKCVAKSVRYFKISLNDSGWSSTVARAAGLRDLGLAQLGSLGVVDDREFARVMAEQTTRIMIPQLFRKIFTDRPDCLAAADRCEAEGSRKSAAEAAWAAWAARAAWVAEAARAAEAADPDHYLKLSASFALAALRELKSPGCALLEKA